MIPDDLQGCHLRHHLGLVEAGKGVFGIWEDVFVEAKKGQMFQSQTIVMMEMTMWIMKMTIEMWTI